jgi:gamma-glutamylaminecyclotransferase
MKLKFTDGVVIETSGPLRKLHLHDGWYVVGMGFSIPMASEDEADATILQMNERKLCDLEPKRDIESTCTHLVFVYGTLRQGQWNHHFLESSRFVGMAKTKERFALYGTGIPFLSRRKAISQVTGEVYAVDDATLERLDELEGHPDGYRREQADVVLEDGTVLKAWIYFHDAPYGDLIKSGDFLIKNEPRRRKRSV